MSVFMIMLVFSRHSEAATLIDTDFGIVNTEVQVIDEGKKLRVTGMLPDGWSDNSSWASVTAEYTPMKEDDIDFLRLNIKEIAEGRCQISYRPLPDINRDSYYRLSLKIRNFSTLPVTLGIRTLGPPYNFFWEEVRQFSKSWEEHSYDFRMRANRQPVGFWIVFNGEGMVDIASLKLMEHTRQELLDEMKAKYKGDRPENLLRVSRFPLGIQSGWSLDRDSSDGDDVSISADPDVLGPSGSPSLHIKSEGRMRLYTAPFAVPMAFEEHIASLYMRGDGAVRLTIVCDGRSIANKNYELTGEWERLNLVFTPEPTARAYGINIAGQGNFWLDSMQVEPGTEMTSYKGQLACEVALACPETDASAALVQFEDEEALVNYCVSGEADGAVLKSKIVNLYGEEKLLDDVTLGEDFLQYGEIRYNVFPERPYGAFRVEAWVENPDGQRISPYNEIVVYRLHRPMHWMEDSPDSPFGVHTNSTTRHILMAKAVGVNWVRLHDAGLDYLGWYHLEPEPGKWEFRDKELYRYRKFGMRILGELGTAPKWASYYQDVGRDHSGYFDRFYQPKRMEDYANYVRTVTQRYKGVIMDYDVWNEPWIQAWWAVRYDESKRDRDGYITSEDPTGDFVKLMSAAYQNSKATDDSNRILGVNSTAGKTGTEWTRGIVEHEGLEYCDVVCYHQYTGGAVGYPGDSVTDGFRTATSPIVDRFGRIPRPVWMSEGSSVAGIIGSGFYDHTLPYQAPEDVVSTSDRLCKYIVSLLSQRVRKVFLYSMHSHSYFPNSGQWRVLVTDEGALHPSGAAHSAMAWFLEDTSFIKTLEVADGVYSFLFENSERAVAVLSAKPGHADFKIPQDESIHAVDLFGNPVPSDTVLGDRLIYLWTTGGMKTLEDALKGNL